MKPETRRAIRRRLDNTAGWCARSMCLEDVSPRLIAALLHSSTLRPATDLRRGTHTKLSLQQVKYNSFMKDEAFTLQAIRR